MNIIFIDCITKPQKCNESQQTIRYFLFSKCNIFANIPNHKLLAAQQKVHRIREKPVFHLLNSLTKMKPEKGFYPMINIERLYQILTDESSLTMFNPGLAGGVGEQQQMEHHHREKKGDRWDNTELIKDITGKQVPGAHETKKTRETS